MLKNLLTNKIYKNKHVDVTEENSVIKVTNKTKCSTPGIFTKINTQKMTVYKIQIIGYKTCESNVCLWIADSDYNALLFSNAVKLGHNETNIVYYFHNIDKTMLLIGLLFKKSNINDSFFINKCTVCETNNKFNILTPLSVIPSASTLSKQNNKTKIHQIIVSPAIKHFEKSIITKFDFIAEYDINKPCFFFGIYFESDFKKVDSHKSLAIILWSGSDAVRLKQRCAADKNNKFYKIIKKSNVVNIATSFDLHNTLNDMNILNRRIIFNLFDVNKFKPNYLGEYVYIYTNFGSEHVYGHKLYTELIERMPNIKFIICSANTYRQDDMRLIYSQCFIGIRLTIHDGGACTVQEMGLCGIMCVHNSDLPNAINYKNVDDIINAVNVEKNKINTINKELSDTMKKYLSQSNDWLYTEHYEFTE